ncbi:MAG: cyclic nucleotide-binding domain-containing protein [Verrucomicrobia bacterium]|nr:cyclic nucleotide-binding domain-containing protein [Verrucomicrobiota bacterium]
MDTFEKMLFIKSLPLFKYIKDDILVSIASVLEEQIAGPGELIIQKGALGSVMFMIVEGKVKVHDEGRVLKEIGPHEVFGELAALSPEKRIASVTALEETFLLKIDNMALYDLMEMQIDLAKGIIHVLCQRTRSIASDLNKALDSHG